MIFDDRAGGMDSNPTRGGMDIFRSLNPERIRRPAWLAVGTFDGVHLGHAAILNRMLQCAKRESADGVAITFDTHPQETIRPSGTPFMLLTPPREKRRLLEGLGVHRVRNLPFTRDVARLGAEAFIDGLLRSFDLRGMVAGYDHGFGSGRRGGVELIRELGARFGFAVEVVEPVTADGEPVSSTRIRRLLTEGNVEAAGRVLGRSYALPGVVVRGKGVGKVLGFPTANVQPEEGDKLLPRDGVYAARVQFGGRTSAGTVNIGMCPTIGQSGRTIEAYIHGFKGDLLGQSITVDFLRRLRDELSFESPEALAEQIRKDIENSRQESLNTN
jgi:riboflavin kinase/FMN adenylyltransferase